MFFKTKHGTSFNLNLVTRFYENKEEGEVILHFGEYPIQAGENEEVFSDTLTLREEDAKAFLDKIVSTPLASLTKAVFT